MYNSKNTEEIVGIFQEIIPKDNIELCDIIESRRMIELSTVQIVIDRVEENDIIALEGLINEMDQWIEDGVKYAALDGLYHTRVIECGKNKILTLFITTLNDMIDREILKNDIEIRQHAQIEHKKILNAIRKRDNIALKEAMNSHLLCFKSLYF